MAFWSGKLKEDSGSIISGRETKGIRPKRPMRKTRGLKSAKKRDGHRHSFHFLLVPVLSVGCGGHTPRCPARAGGQSLHVGSLACLCSDSSPLEVHAEPWVVAQQMDYKASLGREAVSAFLRTRCPKVSSISLTQKAFPTWAHYSDTSIIPASLFWHPPSPREDLAPSPKSARTDFKVCTIKLMFVGIVIYLATSLCHLLWMGNFYVLRTRDTSVNKTSTFLIYWEFTNSPSLYAKDMGKFIWGR